MGKFVICLTLMVTYSEFCFGFAFDVYAQERVQKELLREKFKELGYNNFTYNMGLYRLLESNCGYKDDDLKKIKLTFNDIGLCNAEDAKWVKTGNGLSDSIIDLYYKNGYLYAVTQSNKIFKTSVNGSENWIKIDSNIEQLSNNDIKDSLFKTITIGSNNFILTDCGMVFRSEDNNTATLITENPALRNKVKNLYYDGSLYLYAITNDGGIFKTDCKEENWSVVNDGGFGIVNARMYGIDEYNHIIMIEPENESGATIKTIINDKIDAHENELNRIAAVIEKDNAYNYIYAISNGGYFKTQDNGKNWIQINKDTISNDVDYLTTSKNSFFDKNTGYLYVGTNHGVLKTNLQPGKAKFSRIAHSQPEYLYTGVKSGFFTANDGGEGWVNVKLKSSVYALYSHNGSLYASINDGTFKTSDNGENWTKLNDKIVEKFYSSGNNLYARFTFDRDNTFVKITDDGKNWSYISSPPHGYHFQARINDLSIYKEYLYLFDGMSNEIRKTKINDYTTWKYTGKLSNHLYNEYSDELKMLCSHNDFLYAVLKNKISRMNNDETSWSEVDIGFKDIHIKELYSSGEYLYARINAKSKDDNDDIVIRTNNDGKNWVQVKNIIKNSHVSVMCAHNGYLFAGTYFKGIFRTKEKVEK